MYEEDRWNEKKENTSGAQTEGVNQSAENSQSSGPKQVYGHLGSNTSQNAGQSAGPYPYQAGTQSQQTNGAGQQMNGNGQYQQASGHQANGSGQYQSGAYSQQMSGNSQYQQAAGAGEPKHHSRRNGGRSSMAKSAAMVTAAALLFGVVSGGTMYGVNRAAESMFPTEAVSPTIPSTSQVAASSTSNSSNNGVVIEDVSSVVDAVMPSVVSITNTALYKQNTWFGETQTYEVPSSGSGIIVGQNETELLVVTNNHVIEDANSLSVTFIDESTVEAAVKGTDADSDLAVIAIPLDKISADTKSKIKTATLGDSDSLKMGQGVIAIGNALGMGQSVTVGHVSALNRQIQVEGVTKTVIQTDAAINPGNSGGALLNAKGELIGINEAKYANTDVEGVGYAIPISQAKGIIDDLMTRTTKIAVNEDEQGYLGIQLQNIDAQTAKLYGMPQGVYVYKIVEGSAASNSDLREKDIITALDGEKIESYADLAELLTYYKAGTTVTLTVQSLENGQYVERQVQLTLGSRPADESQSQNGNEAQNQAGNKTQG